MGIALRPRYCSSDAVRKAPFWSHSISQRSFYQDRLGTNIETRRFFCCWGPHGSSGGGGGWEAATVYPNSSSSSVRVLSTDIAEPNRLREIVLPKTMRWADSNSDSSEAGSDVWSSRWNTCSLAGLRFGISLALPAPRSQSTFQRSRSARSENGVSVHFFT